MKSLDINYCPLCGSPITHEHKFGRERPVCPACGWIFFADPKVAVAILLEEDGRILLVRRANEPFRRLWTLPAGFVNADEDPARAAERECLEETGLNVQVTDILDIRWGREHKRGADFVIFYRGVSLAGIWPQGMMPTQWIGSSVPIFLHLPSNPQSIFSTISSIATS
jgi:8-oxo-dGTP diphosphatase